jgi:hypothetical protein
MIPKRQFRVLTQDEAARYRRRGLTARDTYGMGLLMPVAGSRPDDDDDDDDNDDDDDDSDDDDSDDDNDDDDDDVDPDTETISKAELADLRKKVSDAEAADRRRKDKKRQQQREEGQYKDMAEEAERERDEAKAEAEKAKQELAEFKAQSGIAKVAKRLGFHEPDDAVRFLPEELRTSTDEKVIERALKTIKRDRQYLAGDPKATGGGHGGGGAGGGSKNGGGKLFTKEEMDGMSQDQINDNWSKVQKSLAALTVEEE